MENKNRHACEGDDSNVCGSSRGTARADFLQVSSSAGGLRLTRSSFASLPFRCHAPEYQTVQTYVWTESFVHK